MLRKYLNTTIVAFKPYCPVIVLPIKAALYESSAHNSGLATFVWLTCLETLFIVTVGAEPPACIPHAHVI